MRRKLGAIIAIGLALLLTGCQPQVSLFPLYTKDDTFFDPQLLGEWHIRATGSATPEETPTVIEFRASPLPYTYDVKIPNFDEEQHNALCTEARLVKLGKYVFIDFGMPPVDKLAQVPYPAVEGHTFGRLTVEGETARIDFLNDDWIKDAIKAGRMPLTYQDASSLVLSAATSDLRRFTLDHAEDHAAFSESIRWRARIPRNNRLSRSSG